MKKLDISDYNKSKYGRLTVISFLIKNKKTVCSAMCDCGKLKEYVFSSLKKGLTKSCGCIRKDSKFGIIGNILLISKIQQILILNCDLPQTSLQIDKRHNTPNIVTVGYGGTNQICRIRNYLYTNATFFLQRKYDKMFSIVPFQLPEKPPCSVCGRPSHIKGMCKSHYEYNRIKSKR